MLFLYGAILFALTHWFFVHRNVRIGMVLTKPLVMLCLLGWLAHASRAGFGRDAAVIAFSGWFFLALLFGLMGDLFLLGPERTFLPGLISFLIGHLCYIAGFRPLLPGEGRLLPGVLALVFIATASGLIFRKLAAGMRAAGNGDMLIPAGIYSIVISLMLFMAATRGLHPGWKPWPCALAGAGAFLFYLSDLLNAWSRFVGPIQLPRLKIMISYHLAQIFLTAAAVIQVSQLAAS